MAKTPEIILKENQPLPENKDLPTIDNLLEETLSFVENIVDNPGSTREELENQTWLVIDKFKKFHRDNLFKIFKEFEVDFRGKKFSHKGHSILHEKDETSNITTESVASYGCNNEKRNFAFTVERSKFIPAKEPEPENKWQKILFQKYIIKIKENRFESFEFYENKFQEGRIGVEVTRSNEIKVTYSPIGEPSKLEINMEFNPLKEDEFFLSKPSAVKKKSLEIELF